MKTQTAFRLLTSALPLTAGSLVPLALCVSAQVAPAPIQPLLEKAHALEARGRMDMAAQTWQQVLLADPNNTEALGGLARAAKLSGNSALAGTYLDRLRAINPNDPNIARTENLATELDRNQQLQRAGKLAQQGQYAQAMVVYRQVYGDNPPPGDYALAYYETEAATEDGRAHAIAGLRSIVAKNPGDAKSQIALGRILTYNPKTRAEGRKLLEAHPADPQATEALRQSLLWDAQNPASTAAIREYLAHHTDAQLAGALKSMPPAARPMTAEQRAQAALNASRSAADAVAYRALNAKHLAEAEVRFKAILANTPDDPNALVGMGYVRMQQANFGGALSFLSQGQQDGSKDPGLEAALATSRFWFTMGQGADALNANDLPEAEKQYRIALGMRPSSVEALEGLGGTLLKAQQPEAAIPYFAQFTKLKPNAAHAWRGLFLAEAGAGNAAAALATEQAMPSSVRAELAKDPLYLRSLSSAYASVGRDADAQRILRAALDLPFPADTRGLEVETELQYAGLLQAANHLDQAAGLYRQVLLKDSANIDAWQGLIRAEHQLNQDPQALQSLESMPPATYARAMRDLGFEATVAFIYESQKRLDVAQQTLEKAIAQQASTGQKSSAPLQLQLAGVYLERDNPRQAYPLYRKILSEYPDRPEAWKGLLAALHSTGRDQDALAQVQQIPAATRAQLENDVDFLQTMGSVYSQLGQPQQSQLFLRRVQQHYAQQHTAAPASVDIQNAWLLFNGMNDQGLYRQLLALGSRTDLTDAQRRTVQTIWANWAVRRANQLAAAGNQNKALATLNATARAFPDNPGVIKALAGGYTRAGMPKEAVLIWKAQDLTSAPASDYRAAAGSALAANDTKDAETWLRFGLEQYPKDPGLLILGAKFEQARGDTKRAEQYYRASLQAMPPTDPGVELATELASQPGRPLPMAGSQLPSTTKPGQDLATLLAPTTSENAATPPAEVPPPAEPYLPSYGAAGTAPTEIDPNRLPAPAVPSYMTSPDSAPQNPSLPAGSRTRLRDYVPQASVEELLPADATALPTGAEGLSGNLVLTPAMYQQQQVTRITRQVESQQEQRYQQQQTPESVVSSSSIRPGPLTAQPVSTATLDPATGEVYGPYVPYKPAQVQLGVTQPAPTPPHSPLTDELPTARYVPNARTKPPASSSPDRAAAMRRQQSNSIQTGLTGESKPPEEQYTTAPIETVQYLPYNPGASNGQVAQPATATTGSSQAQVPQTSGDSYGQQYPQPRTGATTPRSRAKTTHPARTPAVTAETPAPAPTPALSYPGISQPLTYQPYPQTGPAVPLGPAPTDAELLAEHVPALRGNYAGAVAPQVPLTERQQAERDLETLESSYSGWLGGTASARYRSGTVGLDRLTDLETTVEASVTLANQIRLSIVPRAVFLNSGVLNVGAYAGQTTNIPVLGSLPLNAATAPAQQVTNGVGGEFQVAGRNFAAAIGYTPYEFLVHNYTGRVLYKPTSHFTLYGSREAVTETQLSYAGLRDPNSAGGTIAGNIWGGASSTGGGVRFDLGDERAGFYITADGADLTGSHVLENNRFEGSLGAYFLAHSFAGIGRINVGASLFGMHYASNERGLSYGLGGYFSPDAYFLASVPVTFTGRYRNNFHYTIAGSVGVQTFQEASQSFFPLDRSLQTTYDTAFGCTAAQIAAKTCGYSPINSNTGANYGFNSEAAYRITEHWYAGGFLSANNTNNYNSVTGGFFVRYLFRPQFGTDDYPTGLFPVEGFRPLRVP